jgi:hypothetical protein
VCTHHTHTHVSYNVQTNSRINHVTTSQLIGYSALAHAYAFLHIMEGGKAFPSQLVHDFQKSVQDHYANVAKLQCFGSHDSKYFNCASGSDQLERSFSNCRTRSHNRNVDHKQLIENLAIACRVDDILAQHPDWATDSRRLSSEKVASGDHFSPYRLKGDLSVRNVDLHLVWDEGRRECVEVMREVEGFADCENIFKDLWQRESTLLRLNGPCSAPYGVNSLEVETFDESSDPVQEDDDGVGRQNTEEWEDYLVGDLGGDVRDLVVDPKVDSSTLHTTGPRQRFPPLLECPDGSTVYKATLVRHLSDRTPWSSDRLSRLKGLGRKDNSKGRDVVTMTSSDEPMLCQGDPFAVIVIAKDSSHGELPCLAICVADKPFILRSKKPVASVPIKSLAEGGVTVQFNLVSLHLSHADLTDEAECERGELWHGRPVVCSGRVDGNQIILFDPDLHCIQPSDDTQQTRFEFCVETKFMEAALAELEIRLVQGMIMPILQTRRLPYVRALAVEGETQEFFFLSGEAAVHTSSKRKHGTLGMTCLICAIDDQSVSVPIEAMRQHVGQHMVREGFTTERCGMCGVEGQDRCALVVTFNKSVMKVDMQGCCPGYSGEMRRNKQWGRKGSTKSPCTNVPVKCELCTNKWVWKYNIRQHCAKEHASLDAATATMLAKADFAISDKEMKEVLDWKH